jgi:ketosteroid isomerase-like protein
MLRRLAVIAFIATILSACGGRPPSADTARTRQLLDSTLAEHARLFINKDLDGLLAAYTDSPVVYSNHAPPVRGHTALRPFLESFTHGGDVRSLSYHTEELAVYGDSAWQILSYEVSVQPTGATAPVADHGAGFALWVRDSAGAWRIHRDIFNSSQPLAAAQSSRVRPN